MVLQGSSDVIRFGKNADTTVFEQISYRHRFIHESSVAYGVKVGPQSCEDRLTF
jgi:hypothetical protein